MLIENALWIAGRAAGVAEHRRLALVAFDPGIIVAFGGDQILELAIIETDIMLDRLPTRFQPLDDQGEGDVVEEDSILGVVGAVDQLVVAQTRVDRLEDAAHAHGAIPRDYVAAVVQGATGSSSTAHD